jgi:hypothetical protein
VIKQAEYHVISSDRIIFETEIEKAEISFELFRFLLNEIFGVYLFFKLIIFSCIEP